MNISIVIPSFNRSELLKKTLESIISQTSPNWECIVVDDFSKDNTKEVVCSFLKRDIRITYLLNEHKKGAQGARNTGLDYAKYDWVIFFDSDNIMHCDFVERMLPHLNDDIDVCACCSDVVDIEKGAMCGVMNPRCYGVIHDDLFSGKSYVDFNHGIIRKRKLMDIGGLDEDCPSMQEWDTHIRLSKNCRYTTIEDSLIDYYVGGGDAISSDKKREVIGRLYILRKHISEWRKRQKSLTLFSYQIYRLIELNTDKNFVKEKIEELGGLVSHLRMRLFFCKFLDCVSQFKNMLVKK